jgi:hypothetical protein
MLRIHLCKSLFPSRDLFGQEQGSVLQAEFDRTIAKLAENNDLNFNIFGCHEFWDSPAAQGSIRRGKFAVGSLQVL